MKTNKKVRDKEPMNNREQMPGFEDDSIDLLPIFRAWLKKWWLIVVVMLACGIAAFAVTKLAITPMYRSSFSAYINNNKGGQDGNFTLSSSDLSASRSLAKTYSAITTSQTVLERAMVKAGYIGQHSALVKNISTEIETDTEILKVYVKADSPLMARLLADAIAEALSDCGPDIVEGSSIKIIDKPREISKPYSPNAAKNAVIGAFVGALIVLVVLTLQTLFNTTLSNENVLEERFGVPVLGKIPRQEDAERGSRYGYSYGYGRRNSEVKKNG